MKLQVVFSGEAPRLDGADAAGMTVLHESAVGRVHTIIFRGAQSDIEERLGGYHPVFMEAVPLTLEEIFIYELGGADYAVKDIIL